MHLSGPVNRTGSRAMICLIFGVGSLSAAEASPPSPILLLGQGHFPAQIAFLSWLEQLTAKMQRGFNLYERFDKIEARLDRMEQAVTLFSTGSSYQPSQTYHQEERRRQRRRQRQPQGPIRPR